MIARIILGIDIGAFWAMLVTAAIRLVLKDKAAKASPLVFNGIYIHKCIKLYKV